MATTVKVRFLISVRKRAPDILPRFVDESQPQRVAALFFSLLETAHCSQRRVPSLLRVHAFRYELVGLAANVIPEFLVDFVFDLVTSEQRTKA